MYMTINTQDTINTLALNVVHREREVHQYQINIDNYTAMLAALPQGEVPAEIAPYMDTPTEELELKLIKDIGDNIGVLFDTQQQITNFYLELEETSKTNYDPTQNTSKKAIERALIELQLEKLMEQVREAMVYAPAELKDLYGRFLKMHAKIEQEQAWARAELIRRNRLARWRQEQDEIRTIETISGVIAVMFISMFFGWLMWQLRALSGGF